MGVFAFLLSQCTSRLPSSYRYRMTVEVDTPQGVRTGSAVREVSYSRRLEGVYNANVRGEAVVVDLPGGQTLYALLSDTGGDPDYAGRVADWALKADLKPGGANVDYEAGDFAELWPTQPKTESPLWQTRGPMLVRFGDESNPQSVEKVNAGNLAAHFGSGTTLRRITIEASNERVTEDIANRLRWLPKYWDRMFSGNKFENVQGEAFGGTPYVDDVCCRHRGIQKVSKMDSTNRELI